MKILLIVVYLLPHGTEPKLFFKEYTSMQIEVCSHESRLIPAKNNWTLLDEPKCVISTEED